MATAKLDIARLLTFPSRTKGVEGLSKYNPKLSFNESENVTSPSIGSPPRKTARLEGDTDNSSSRTRDKGKQKARDSHSSGPQVPVYIVENFPDNDLPETKLDSLPRLIHIAIHTLLKLPDSGIPRIIGTRDIIYEDVFEQTRMLVLNSGKGQWIYDKLHFELKEVVASISKRLTSMELTQDMDWLNECVAAACWFDGSIRLLETMLTYLDRVFVPRKSKLQSVRRLAMHFYKTLVFENATVMHNITGSVQQWLVYERSERTSHSERKAISSLITILTDYSLFSAYFLQPFVTETSSFYTNESARLAAELQDVPETFLIHCEERLEEERRRNREVLSAYEGDWPTIIKTTDEALLKDRLRWLSMNVTQAIDGKSEESLERMYRLFARVDGLPSLCTAFKAHVYNRVAGIVRDKEHDEDMVDRLLEFKAFADGAVPKAFGSDRTFRSAATDAFMTGFRVRNNKPAEMIAKYLDREMRRGQKEASDEEFSKKLDALLALYRFTQDKDVFRTFYHRALAKRLLLQRSASDDFERSVLRILKEQYDPEFGMGENMFRDLALSQDLMVEFHERDVGQGTAQALNAMVLQRSFWPFSSKKEEGALLPSGMQADLNKFSAFYGNKHQGRKLDFDHSLGTVQLKARLKGGNKELQVSLHQAIVLLLFNDQDEAGFREIKANTRIEDAELRRTLQSLACAQKKVLRKRPVGREVNDDDVFYYNAEFTDPRARVHINQIQAKETPEEEKRTQTAIEADRKSFLDAAIVRIMKAKKTMKHQALVTAVIDAMKAHFFPEVSMIKSRFESLIEGEYIRRDEEEANVYVYVA